MIDLLDEGILPRAHSMLEAEGYQLLTRLETHAFATSV
jgi:hypothetical protein